MLVLEAGRWHPSEKGYHFMIKNSKFMSWFFKPEIAYISAIFGYVILFNIQLNLPPLERYPGWDCFWGDTIMAGKLISLKYALLNCEIPAISPYVLFDWNMAGDMTLPVSFLSPPNLLILLFPPRPSCYFGQ